MVSGGVSGDAGHTYEYDVLYDRYPAVVKRTPRHVVWCDVLPSVMGMILHYIVVGHLWCGHGYGIPIVVEC